jgi:hypothetical protein
MGTLKFIVSEETINLFFALFCSFSTEIDASFVSSVAESG